MVCCRFVVLRTQAEIDGIPALSSAYGRDTSTGPDRGGGEAVLSRLAVAQARRFKDSPPGGERRRLKPAATGYRVVVLPAFAALQVPAPDGVQSQPPGQAARLKDVNPCALVAIGKMLNTSSASMR